MQQTSQIAASLLLTSPFGPAPPPHVDQSADRTEPTELKSPHTSIGGQETLTGVHPETVCDAHPHSNESKRKQLTEARRAGGLPSTYNTRAVDGNVRAAGGLLGPGRRRLGAGFDGSVTTSCFSRRAKPNTAATCGAAREQTAGHARRQPPRPTEMRPGGAERRPLPAPPHVYKHDVMLTARASPLCRRHLAPSSHPHPCRTRCSYSQGEGPGEGGGETGR